MSSERKNHLFEADRRGEMRHPSEDRRRLLRPTPRLKWLGVLAALGLTLLIYLAVSMIS